MKLTPQNITQECLVASADAHHLAGLLLVEKRPEKETVLEAALQLERTARYLKKFSETLYASNHSAN